MLAGIALADQCIVPVIVLPGVGYCAAGLLVLIAVPAAHTAAATG